MTRKQREIRERENVIIRVARRTLLREGYFGLSMDRLADATECSKGTIYQHFKSKEDVLAAIAGHCFEERGKRLARAATFNGRPRERMIALAVADDAFCRSCPEFGCVQPLINIPAFRTRATDQRRLEMSRRQDDNHGIFMGVIRDGVARDDLRFSTPHDEDSLLAAWLALGYGWRILGAAHDADAEDRGAVLLDHRQALLDGVAWRPLSSEWDYRETIERAEREMAAGRRRGAAADVTRSAS